MSIVKTEAVLLRKRDYSETSIIAVCYTRDFGKLNFLIKGAKQTSKLSQLLEYFSCYEILFRHRCGNEGLTVLWDIHRLESFPLIQCELSRFYHASYCLELVDAFTELEDEDPSVFDLIKKTLACFHGSAELFAITRVFEFQLLKKLGFLDDVTLCDTCRKPLKEGGILDQKTARLFCCDCMKHGSIAFDWNDLNALKKLETDQTLAISTKSKMQIQKLLWYYIDFHLGKTLKSRQFVS